MWCGPKARSKSPNHHADRKKGGKDDKIVNDAEGRRATM